MVRWQGLAIDQLLGARVMLADRDIVKVSGTEKEDLFYALRGGGGNF